MITRDVRLRFDSFLYSVSASIGAVVEGEEDDDDGGAAVDFITLLLGGGATLFAISFSFFF